MNSEPGTMNSPTISIIIPAYNAADTIALTLGSVLKQTFTDYEIIVIDDASSDDTVAVVENIIHHPSSAERLRRAGESLRIKNRIISLEENMGPAGARNAGIAVARGEWLAFLDGDDLWPEYKLELQLREAEKNPDAVLICGFAPSFNDENELPEKEDIQISYTRKIKITDFEETNPVATSSVLVKRQTVLDIGGFDEQFRGPEDMDLWMRIVKDNKAVLLDIPLAYYRERPGSLCMDSERFLKEVLKVYDKAFAAGGALYEKRFLRKRVIATRYTSAAWGLLSEGKRWRALRYLLKGWIIHPGKIVQEMRYPHWRLNILRKIVFNIKDSK